jgi:hypothetical protein
MGFITDSGGIYQVPASDVESDRQAGRNFFHAGPGQGPSSWPGYPLGPTVDPSSSRDLGPTVPAWHPWPPAELGEPDDG